jgi:2,4-dienoyl-CoA reductase-like NADH-dependent reductase (Old Yellow Enzyme family)
VPSLFSGLTINKLRMANRFVRSATMDSMADHGITSQREIELYRELGQGDIGLIISHGLYPTKEGQCSPGQLSVHSDEAIRSLKSLVGAVHQGGGKIAAQILHGGWMCTRDVTGMDPVGPSPVVHPRSGAIVRQLSSSEIHELVAGYGRAAARIIEAGFDGIQLHGAHSWLISAFLSPATNLRNDEWGGSLENRARFVRELYRSIRIVAGHDYPILIKLGLKDYHPQGKTVAEGIRVAGLLEQDGFDAIEISEGLEQDFFHHIRRSTVAPYYLDESRQARKELSLPLMLVGGMRTVIDMQRVLDEGVADAISMCRPFIMNPRLVRDLSSGLAGASECNSCNECMARMNEGWLRCVLV